MAIAETDPDFDTLAHTRQLGEAGVEERQAEAHAEAARTVRAGLATKADLDAGLDSLETRLAVRFFGGLAAFAGTIVAGVELLQGAP